MHGLRTRAPRVTTAAFAALALTVSAALAAAQEPGGQNVQPPAAKSAAPVDLTGYWVSQIVDEFRFRVTPQKGDKLYMPLTPEAEKVAKAWDPDRDLAAGQQCKAYGAVGLMQRPGRLHITWADDNTLKIEADSGTQTRLLKFGAKPARLGAPSLQGYSAARWLLPAAGRGRGSAPPTGTLEIVTTNMTPGYMRKNGVPYSGNQTVLTEHVSRLNGPNGLVYLTVTAIVEDAVYLTQPFIRTYSFKKVPDATGWAPTPCWNK